MGRELELEEKIFTVGSKTRSDQFVETTKKLALYCGRTYKEGVDIKRLIKDLSTYTLVEPIARTGTVVGGAITPLDTIATCKWQPQYFL